ncbi:MAG TPA: cytochrome c [Bryobacteraceae bacterium]|jgi:mono/diheme cytochrome c family protein|nr:cytochrome c [Bryobacteraceae bacterium]
MKVLIGFGLGLVVIVLGAFLYFGLGLAPVATSAAPMPFESRLAGMALHARISKEAPKQAPIPADEPNMLAGARIYREQCSVCHGLSGQPETPIAKGMFPRPPQLFTGHGVTDDPPGETYWKAANGIRLTGMPGYKGSLTDTQLWQVSVMLANADKLSPAAKAAVAEPAK